MRITRDTSEYSYVPQTCLLRWYICAQCDAKNICANTDQFTPDSRKVRNLDFFVIREKEIRQLFWRLPFELEIIV